MISSNYGSEEKTQITYPLRVVCCPRSGSLYTAKLLRSKGWYIGWEHYQPHGLVSWMSTVDTDWVPFGKAPTANRTFEHTIAVVRNPLKTIGSIKEVCFNPNNASKFLKFVRQHITLEDSNHLCMAVQFYCSWMQLIQSLKPEIIIQVENRPEVLLSFAWYYLPFPDYPLEPHPKNNCHHMTYNYPSLNTIRQNCGSWLTNKVIQTANALQYEIS